MSSNLVITARGMASSLGGCVEACAAQRVGFMRASNLDLAFSVNDDEYPVELLGNVCETVQGFESYPRLAYLASLAMEDLANNYDQRLVLTGRVAIILVVPKAEERPALDDYEFRLGKNGDTLFYTALQKMAKFPVPFVKTAMFRESHAGAIQAIAYAQHIISQNEVDVCLIGAVDSYMDLSSLEWLYSTKQLKTPDSADGLRAGEGAAFVVVEREQTALARNCPVLAALGPVYTVDEGASFNNESHVFNGEKLSEACLGVIEQNPNRGSQIAFAVTDLNGQSVRAKELANTFVKLQAKTGRDIEKWEYVSSYGDVGAASGLFALNTVLHSFVRQYAPSSEALICASSYSGLRGALIMKKLG